MTFYYGSEPTVNVGDRLLQNDLIDVGGQQHIPRRCPFCRTAVARPWILAPDRFHGRTQLYHLFRCSSCSIVWLADPPAFQEMGEHYGSSYDDLIATAGEGVREGWREPIETLMHYESGGDLLDLGCSTGSFLTSIKGGGWKLYGIEMSERAAKRAQDNSEARVFVGDVLDAPFAPASFDAITCFHVLEHMYRPDKVLQKVWEWLKPGGVFVVYIPNIDSAGARIFKSYWYGLELPRHLYHFSPASLCRMTRDAGFKELSITTHRALFFEYSSYYVASDLMRRFSISHRPLATAPVPSLLWKIARKAFRMAVLPFVTKLTSVVGGGEIIHGIFRKEDSVDS